jgi:large subunit ribosomal protein L7/L12
MKDDVIFCKKCGAEMRFEKDGHSICWICDRCGNASATTYFEPYEIDSTVYHILLSSPVKTTIDKLKLISEIANCNYIEAKKLIESAPLTIFSGKAIEVKPVKEKLEKADIDFNIEPEFPY